LNELFSFPSGFSIYTAKFAKIYLFFYYGKIINNLGSFVKIPKLKIHTQILLALLLGSIFGAIFSINQTKLFISHSENGIIKESAVEKWESLTVYSAGEKIIANDFSSKEQVEIIAYVRKLIKKNSDFSITVKSYKNSNGEIVSEKEFREVKKVYKQKTAPMQIKWIGDLFIRLLNMIAIPLVIASLIVGAASLGDIRKVTRIGGKTIGLYLITTFIALTIGVSITNLIKPGSILSEDTKSRLLAAYESEAADKFETNVEMDFSQEVVNLFPKNPFEAMSSANMLQIIFFIVFFGISLSSVSREKSEPVINFFDGVSETMIKLVDYVMIIAPYGVFALIAATVSEFGFNILQTLFWYSLTVVLGLLLHTLGAYSLLIKLFTKMKLSVFFRGMREVHAVAFSTSSSAATLPLNMEMCQKNFGTSKSITSFVLPLGATINMDGTALYQGVAAIFISQVYSMELNIMQQLTIILTATLASIGTAPIPGVGIVMLAVVLRSVGIPQEGIAMILGVDRILDMCRTVTNVTGDAAVNVSVAATENELNHEIAMAAASGKQNAAS